MTDFIQKALQKYAELKEAGRIPTLQENFVKHPTPLRAIRLFCIECQGGNRLAPAGCDSKTCPLWQFRMGKRNAKRIIK
jgi:hypothetical protein